MKPIVEKVLASGLVDEATARMMEHFKMIPDGSAELAKDKEAKLKSSTETELKKLAEDLATEVEKEHKIRETALDLERMKWPCVVDLIQTNGKDSVCVSIAAMSDRWGRYYFRVQDVKAEWLTPGYRLQKLVRDLNAGDKMVAIQSPILEAQLLYIGDVAACWQVSVGDAV
jgi:hypothetical protein